MTTLYNHNGHIYGTAAYDNYNGYPDWVAGSCGARFTTDPNVDLTRIHNGIKIVTGHVQQPVSNAVFSITHLNTKAGPLTIGLRKKIRA